MDSSEVDTSTLTATDPTTDMRTAPVFEALAHDLRELDVDTVFGLMGEDTAKLITAMLGVGIKYYSARHENTAVAMADGYARATGRLGVCAISRGPGWTNGLTAAANAARVGSPLLVILGNGAVGRDPNRVGPDYKEFDNAGVGVAAGVAVYAPRTAESVRPALRDAVQRATRGSTVALMIPIDQLNHPVVLEQPSIALGEPRAELTSVDEIALELAIDLVRASERPLIVAGIGAHSSGARDALSQLANRSGALIGTTLRAKDMFVGHPYNVGIVGTYSHQVARHLASTADLVLAFGAGLAEHTVTSGDMFPNARIVQVDQLRANIGRHSRVDVGVVGDAKVVAERITEALDGDGGEMPFHDESTLHRLATVDFADEFESRDTRWTIDPRTLVLELADILPADRIVVHDIGNFMSFVAPYLPVKGPDHYYFPMEFSAIGLGLGLGLGVAAGRPTEPTVIFIGDGALLMTLGELETAVRCDLPLTIVVMNDAAYGAEVHYLEVEGMPASAARYPDVDFAEVASSFGIDAFTVRSSAELQALAPSLAKTGGTILLDCKVTPTNRS